MKKAMIAGMMALADLGAGTGKDGQTAGYLVTVYLIDHQIAGPVLLSRAKPMATKAFADIGVRLRWEVGSPRPDSGRPLCPGAEVVIRLATDTPEDFQPGALAYALPYAQSGVRVTIFFDRALKARKQDMLLGPVTLAHVLSHEIAHVLQGVARHSDRGIMTPRQTCEDWARMGGNLPPFTPYDAELIHLALGRGNCGAPSSPLAAVAPARAAGRRAAGQSLDVHP